MYMDGPNNQSALSAVGDAVPAAEAAALKAVVRGERAVEDFDAKELWTSARHTASHAVCAADLAEGIVNLKDDPVALEELANAIVAISGLLCLEDEQSDRLIAHVWDLSLGQPLTTPTIWLANAIRNRKPVAA
jgi:hypothetical protein